MAAARLAGIYEGPGRNSRPLPEREASRLRLISSSERYFRPEERIVIGLTKGVIVAAVAATTVALAGCSSPPNSITQPKAVARIGQGPGGHVSGLPDAVVVPAKLPRVPAVQSRALCRHIPALTQLEVARLNSLPQNHITFSFPARVVVASPARAQAVATVLCGLPVDPSVNCPADLGVSYWLYFSPARLDLAPVEADPAGCADISGLGVPARWALPRFWRALGTAMHVLRPGETGEAVYRLFGGHWPGT